MICRALLSPLPPHTKRDYDDYAAYLRAWSIPLGILSLIGVFVHPMTVLPALCVGGALLVSSIPCARVVARRRWMLAVFVLGAHLLLVALATTCCAVSEYGSAWRRSGAMFLYVVAGPALVHALLALAFYRPSTPDDSEAEQPDD